MKDIIVCIVDSGQRIIDMHFRVLLSEKSAGNKCFKGLIYSISLYFGKEDAIFAICI